MIENIEKEKIEILKDWLSNCVNAHHLVYHQKEVIQGYAPHHKQIGFITKGTAQVIKTDINGNTTIIKMLKENDIFSNLFFYSGEDEIYIISTEETEILFLDYYFILKNCTKGCPFHRNLMVNLFDLLIRELKQQNDKIELLSQHNVRDKILYFIKRRMNDKKLFKVTTSYKAIAEYLAVDRSNLMRELSKLEQEKIIKKEGRLIYYLK